MIKPSKKIKPDHELEQTKIKLIKQENKLGYLRNMIEANERRIGVLQLENGVLIESLEDTITSQRKHEKEYIKRIEKLNDYMNKMLDLQQPKRRAKKKTTSKKPNKKQILAEKQAALKAEMERLKTEAEIPESEGEEASQTETTI